MQGRLTGNALEVKIASSCAHCGRRMEIVVDSELDYRVVEGGDAILVFEPDVDWSKFTDPNIIHGY